MKPLNNLTLRWLSAALVAMTSSLSSLAAAPATDAPSQPYAASVFLTHCKNPGKNLAIDVAVDALKLYAKSEDCDEAYDALKRSTWLELDHPDLTDLTVVNDFPQAKSLTLISDRSVDLSGLQGMTKLTMLSIVGPIASFELADAPLLRLHIENAENVTIADASSITGLQELYLVNAPINDYRPLQGLSRLRTLRVVYSEMPDLDWMRGLGNLENAYLEHNQFTDVSALAGLANLKNLALSHNPVADLSPLATLNLVNLRISHIPLKDHGQLSMFADLNSLAVAGLGLESLGFVGECNALSELVASRNRLTDASPLRRCAKLRDLNLSHNELTAFVGKDHQVQEADEPGLRSLVNLNLSDNKIMSLSGLPESLFDLKLSRNPLASLAYFAQASHPSLYRLTLSETEVSDLSPLKGTPGLSELTMNDTEVTSLAGLEAVKGLRSIAVNFGRVASVQPLAGLSQLRSISLLGNNITDVSPLRDLEKVVHLDLYSNPLGDTVAKTADNCPTESKNHLLNEWCQE